MSRYAMVDSTDTVVNVIELDEGSKYSPEAGYSVVQITGAQSPNVGDAYIGGAFVPGANRSVVPLSVTSAQLRIALFRAGLLVDVQKAVDAAGGEIAIWWEHSVTVERANRYVLAMAAQLSISTDTVDGVFIAASEAAA